MNTFQEIMSSFTSPGLLIVVVIIVMASGFRKGWIGQFITALNSLNTPWVAMIVLCLGMIYNLKCKAIGLPSDSANQVIGGGLGLLTGQALKNAGMLNSGITTPDHIAPNSIPSNLDPIKEKES